MNFKFTKFLVGNSLRLAGKILVLVKLTALAIYAKAGLLRSRPRTLPQGQGQGLIFARPRSRSRTNITGLGAMVAKKHFMYLLYLYWFWYRNVAKYFYVFSTNPHEI